MASSFQYGKQHQHRGKLQHPLLRSGEMHAVFRASHCRIRMCMNVVQPRKVTVYEALKRDGWMEGSKDGRED